MVNILPISGVIPTRNRANILSATFQSIAEQDHQASEIIVVDASDDDDTKKLCQNGMDQLQSKIIYFRASEKGAAKQRNQAIAHSKYPYIWLFDDDILLDPRCLERLWFALISHKNIGGACCTIKNQKYLPPGRFSKILYYTLHGKQEKTFGGKCIGPVLNLLPEDHPDLPEIIPVEWMNTTCTLYRKESLPKPPFPDFFTGYSMFEDVTLSMTVGKNWELVNARNARIYHDSQPGDHKSNISKLAEMELVNRYHVMTRILNRRGTNYNLKLFMLEFFKLLAKFQSKKEILEIPQYLSGKLSALKSIMTHDK